MRLRPRLCIAFFFLLIPFLSKAQFGETIRTGRPGQSIGGFTLGSQVFQLQSGLTYNKVEVPEQAILLQNNILRLGLTEKVEISALLNWQNKRFAGEEPDQTGISAAHVGGRINVLENKGIIPTLGLQGRLIVPVNSQDYKREAFGSVWIIATGNRLTDWLSFNTNWIIVWDTFSQSPSAGYTVNTGISLSEKWGTFLEMYGQLNGFSTHFDTGLSYLLNPDLQFDLSAGWQGEEGVSNWFVDGGFSWRLVWR